MDTRILATDISVNVIQKAKAGIYSNERIEGVPEAWKRKYFRKVDETIGPWWTVFEMR